MVDAVQPPDPCVGVLGERHVDELVVLPGIVLDRHLGGAQFGEPVVDLRRRGGRQPEHGHETAHAQNSAEGGQQGPRGPLQDAREGLGTQVAQVQT
ncbi:hypothetical protein [Streptomyces sp. NPDC007000]|uniref:hypothetical protein n=1 Tax=Streptomyces sp. NPDC007000 TaxID=3155357 RepID=UPI0033CF8470